MTDVVGKLWGFCHTLRHDGIGYSHYVEQLTYLLFLKMAGERELVLPKKTDWKYLKSLSGTDLLDAYIEALRLLGKQPGILGDIFSGAQSRFSNPVNLKKLFDLIDEIRWTELDVDVKAAAFEGLLEKAASEGKKGAGQYFTPRLLIKAIVRCMKPDPRVARDFRIVDPACGTGGFLVASYEWLLDQTKGRLDRDIAKRIRTQTYFGQDIDPEPRRLAVMNLYLHQVEPHIERKDSIYETPDANRYDVVLTNPPFGTKGANQDPDRDDFTVSTSNKQLNFLQHVLTILKPGGRAAVVVPDNVLFADEAGDIFKVLMEDCDLHTLLRLPRGTFSPYSEGTQTNVLFLAKGRPTEKTWIYDARANVPKITKKERPLTAAHFVEFEKCYGVDPNGRSARAEAQSTDGRWRRFTIADVKSHQYKLDALRWLRDEELDSADDGLEPDELLTEAIEGLRLALDELAETQRLVDENNAFGENPWKAVPLAELIEDAIGGLWGNSADSSNPDEVDVLVVRGADFRDWESKRASNAASRRIPARSLEKRRLIPGDLVLEVSGGGPSQPVGRILVVDDRATSGVPKPLICSNFCRKLRLKGGVDPFLVKRQLEWLYRSGHTDRFQTATTNIRNLRVDDFLARTMIVLPGAQEQSRLTAALDAIEARRSASELHVRTSERAIEQLRQSVLTKVFRADTDGDESHDQGLGGPDLPHARKQPRRRPSRSRQQAAKA